MNAIHSTDEAGSPAARLAFDASRLALVIVLLLAFALRVHRLDRQSLWYDEAVTAYVAAQGIPELTRWTADDIQPPLYYYLVSGWTRLEGRGEWALRFPSVCFSLLTVGVLWSLARQLFGAGRVGRISGLAAALLGAVFPLYVYFAQEARMYAQLTFLGALAGYALLRATGNERRGTKPGSPALSWGSRPSSAKWWLVFILVSVAALYTHYFAAFLLLAYGVCVILACIRGFARADSRILAVQRLLTWCGAVLAIVCLYLPWVPAMLTRYRVDRSYWQGTLKLGEAVRHVAVSFAAGAPEMMLEIDATRLLPWFGLAFGLATASLLWQGVRETKAGGERGSAAPSSLWTLVYLLVCLFVPILTVLALASRTPKFNARYLMMASPAYLLVLAGGLGTLTGGRWSAAARRQTTRSAGGAPGGEFGRGYGAARVAAHVSQLLAAILVVFLVVVSLRSLRNWFTDAAFTKAQWREAAAAVRARIAPDEAVVLVSGHAWSAWDYYAPDIAAIRLPDIDILDVNAALGYDAGQILAASLAGRTGVWLVNWQDETVDPIGIVPHLFDRAGREERVSGQFWQLGLRRWRLPPEAAFPTEPEPAHATTANFDHKLALLGWDDPVNGQITVYWRGLNALARDYRVSLILENPAGREVGRWDGRPAGYNYPAPRWRPGQALFGVYPLPLPAERPSGDYYVTLAVYDAADPSGLDIRDVADNPGGKRVRLGPIRLPAG